MLIFVDYEHADGYDGEVGQFILANRTRLTYRFEDLAGMPCHLVRYTHLSPELLDRLDAKALLISGSATDPGHYSADDLAPLTDLIRHTDLPIFGFCGGFQITALALGAPLVALTGSPADDDRPGRIEQKDDGSLYEAGYHPVEVTGRHPVLDGIGPEPVFRHAHGYHVPDPPDGFTVLASTPLTPVQLAVHDERRIVGTQFHPEYWTDEQPAGRTLIANFLRWSGVTGEG